MRTYDAIEKISTTIMKDNICEAIFLKESIARGDDDIKSKLNLNFFQWIKKNLNVILFT